MKQASGSVPHFLSFTESFSSEIADIQALQVESMGWVCISEGAYIHEGSDRSGVIQVVGVAQACMSESNILWVF